MWERRRRGRRIGDGLVGEDVKLGMNRGERGTGLPIVPLPPTLKWPKRLKGWEQMVMLGVTLRMTCTSDGLEGTSLEVIVADAIGYNRQQRLLIARCRLKDDWLW